MDIHNDLGDIISNMLEKPFVVERKVQRFTNPKPFMDRLLKEGHEHWIRRGSECTEIIFGNDLITWTTTVNFPRKKLYLFNSVKKDVIKWLADKKDVAMPPDKKDSHVNLNYDDTDGRIVGTDLNHAYWRIAFVKGIISRKTYDNGMTNDDPNVQGKIKALRLATLSVLGREKKFEKFVDGKVVDELIIQERNPLHQKIFLYIRQTCYNMMSEIAQKLGDDFESWKVDCIYYRDTEKNRQIVSDYFNRKKMTFKYLDYFEDPNEVEPT